MGINLWTVDRSFESCRFACRAGRAADDAPTAGGAAGSRLLLACKVRLGPRWCLSSTREGITRRVILHSLLCTHGTHHRDWLGPAVCWVRSSVALAQPTSKCYRPRPRLCLLPPAYATSRATEELSKCQTVPAIWQTSLTMVVRSPQAKRQRRHGREDPDDPISSESQQASLEVVATSLSANESAGGATELIGFADGACRGNPGRASWGAVLWPRNGRRSAKPLWESMGVLEGSKRTNNEVR